MAKKLVFTNKQQYNAARKKSLKYLKAQLDSYVEDAMCCAEWVEKDQDRDASTKGEIMSTLNHWHKECKTEMRDFIKDVIKQDKALEELQAKQKAKKK